MCDDYSPEPIFSLPEPQGDLRLMLRRHVTRRVVEALHAGKTRRARARSKAEVRALSEWVCRRVVSTLGDAIPGRGNRVHPRVVSRRQERDFAIENVVFESLPGWKVNATVWTPDPRRWAPPWRAIVTPVGHNGKYHPSEQHPPQVFAQHGYLSISFDPPGFGEKAEGNSHFVDGARAYLVGTNPLLFFVADAIRAIDYLQTRPDVDGSPGFAMTGVSGGGFTSIIAPMLDRRISVIGPSCFGLHDVIHPVRNGYGGCPEVLFAGRYGDHIEMTDLMIAPRFVPQLMMAGARDDALDIKRVTVLAREVAALYEKAGYGERFRFFADRDAAHAYSPEQAFEFVEWLQHWWGANSGRSKPGGKADLILLPPSALRSGVERSASMRSIIRGQARGLSEQRRSGAAALRRFALLRTGRPSVRASSAVPQRVWAHEVQEITLRVEGDVELPATLLRRVDHRPGGLAVVYFDDRGRWAPLERGGWLGKAGAFLEREGPDITVLSVDLRGWGDTRPAAAPFDLTSWGGADRWLAYTSAALGDPLLAMRLRDAQAALDFLLTRLEHRPRRIVVGGRGLGGNIAALVAAMNPKVSGVVLRDFLGAFQLLTEADTPTWPHDVYAPGLLQLTDMPELFAALQRPVAVVNPLDAQQGSLPAAQARRLLARPGSRLTWFSHDEEPKLVQWVRAFLPNPR